MLDHSLFKGLSNLTIDSVAFAIHIGWLNKGSTIGEGGFYEEFIKYGLMKVLNWKERVPQGLQYLQF